MSDEQKLAEILANNDRPPVVIGDWIKYPGHGLGMVSKVDAGPGVVKVLFVGKREPLAVWLDQLTLVSPVLEAGERVRHQGRGLGTVTAVWGASLQADVCFDDRYPVTDLVHLNELRRVEEPADPGPAPTHDANGWPTDVASPARGDCADSLFEDCVDGGGGTVYRVECPHGRWLERVRAGRALYRANRWHGFADTTNPPTAYHAPDMPAESPAGPASSSASPSGTGGPNPAYASANGWPIDSPPAPVTADGEVHTPSLFVPTSADQAPTTWVCRTCTVKDFMPVWPCAAVAEVYEAGASLSGTGGPAAALDRMVGRLVAAADEARTLAQRATAIAEEQEGRRREAWDTLVRASRRARQPDAGRTEAAHANAWRDAYKLMVGLPAGDLARRLDAELAARYPQDTQGGEPRG